MNRTGESLTLIRKGHYTIHAIRPCTMERGKVMAKITLATPPADLLTRLSGGPFTAVKAAPDLGVATLRLRGMHIMVFASGEISIRTADSREDIIAAAELLGSLLLPRNHSER